MRIAASILLVIILFGFCFRRFLWRRRRISLAKARRKMYKKLNAQAEKDDIQAMYRLAKLFYKEKNPKFYPLIFRWVVVLAERTKDPAVYLMLGDLYYFGCGTKKDLQNALHSYEQALSAAIMLGKDTSISLDAHNYLESQIFLLRQKLGKETN